MSEPTKKEVLQELSDFYDRATSRTQFLKKKTQEALRTGEISDDVDPHTREVIRMTINARMSRLKRKSDVKEIMQKIHKDKMKRQGADESRQKEVKELLGAFHKDRMKLKKAWQELDETMQRLRQEAGGTKQKSGIRTQEAMIKKAGT